MPKKRLKVEEGMVIFTIGAGLTPKQQVDGSWAWVVTVFEETTFCDGTECDPCESADTIEELMNEEEEEE